MAFHQSTFDTGTGGAFGASTQSFGRLSSAQLRVLRNNHLKREWPALCRRILLEMILKDEPRFKMGDTSIYTYEVSPEFRENIRMYYMPFLEHCFDELMILGVVVVKIVQAPSGDYYPKVVPSKAFGYSYDFRIYRDEQTGSEVYKVFKLRKKDGTLLNNPVEDRKAFVFSGMMPTPGPSFDGDIYSVAASLAGWQQYYDRMMIFSMQAVCFFHL